MDEKILIILPTYNEARNLEKVAEKIITINYSYNILIIDDNSSDGTKEVAKELEDRYICNMKIF